MLGWFVLLALVLIAVVGIYSALLPKYFLKFRYRLPGPSGRGLKIVRDERGGKILCEPGRETRPYIKRYILSEQDGKKYLTCKTDGKVGYLDYDVVLFDAKSRAFKNLRVRERVGKSGITRALTLPKKTCCVSLLINRADDVRFDHRAVREISKGRMLFFAALCVLSEALGFFAVYICVARAFGGLYAESFLFSGTEIAIFAAFCAEVALINALIAWQAVKIKNRDGGR